MAYGITRTVPTPAATHSGFVAVLGVSDFTTTMIDGGASSLLNGGGNLRIYDSSSKTTQYPIQVVTFVTGGSPQVAVFVYLPTWTTGDTLYIERDAVATVQPATGATGGRDATWQGFEAVWLLEEGQTETSGAYIDSTGNSHDGTGFNLAGTTPVSGSVAFDGVNDYVQVPHSAAIKPTGSYTIFSRFQANITGSGTEDRDLLCLESLSPWMKLSYQKVTDKAVFTLTTGGSTSDVVGTTTLADSTYYSMAGVYDGVNAAINVNGTNETTAAKTGTPTTSSDVVTIGNRTNRTTSNGTEGDIALSFIRMDALSSDFLTDLDTTLSSGSFGLTGGTWADSGGGGFQAAWVRRQNRIIGA
tara:strand:- start:17422 stop:18495 length:1074 start_codon:yes stop_codon:yes gene_type:complete